MLSLPEDWDYTLAGLCYINRESKDAIRTAIHELEQAGYIHRRQTTDSGGKFAGNVYTIYERPQGPPSGEPSSEKPSSGNPTTGKPMPEKPTQQKYRKTKYGPIKIPIRFLSVGRRPNRRKRSEPNRAPQSGWKNTAP